jgi:hypothetical protein
MPRKTGNRKKTSRLGSGQRFQKCVESVTKSAKSRGYPLVSASAVCAAIGRKKYGAKKFAQLSAMGRKRKLSRRKGSSRKKHNRAAVK